MHSPTAILIISVKLPPPQWQRDMARWCNRKELVTTCEYEDYSYQKRKKLRNEEKVKFQMNLFEV